ncbi:MAG: VOC family protein [Synechococcales cyanobacterium CRU_2_2]|nr:VOC family protein [Synechococcales cyanobacterium CRU_2_2]
MKSIATFFMFVGEQAGKAEEAMTFYTSLFSNSKIVSIERYGAGEHEPEGTVKVAKFTLNGVEHRAIDSHLEHQFTFTPAISLFVECESMEELKAVHQALTDQGSELMPLDDYGFSKQFSWVSDRYGVSWQLNLG